ncbi:hypothetical protein Sjap_001625 [Stephania japonica]|uniref:HECT-type E3 ubiquitin transferase n=1 Tax=Stephania japonica TaxID=461633 RepID=A0AAP0KL70_9MAGN
MDSEESEQTPPDSSRNNQPSASAASRHQKFEKILASLGAEGAEESTLLAELRALCDLLSFNELPRISNDQSDTLAVVLVALANYEVSPLVMLLSVRAMTYICDAAPDSAQFLVNQRAVGALCAKLGAIEYLDVAEQCVQALQKISYYHPQACLEEGAVMAFLSYIDFFTLSTQRVAVSAVANICSKIPSSGYNKLKEAVPVLCNLLQYEDQMLVKNAAICLTRMVKQLNDCSDLLDDLCKHGVIHQVTHLLSSLDGTALGQSVFNGLIGLLSGLASKKASAITTLVEFNISNTLKHILSSNDFSNSTHSHMRDDLQVSEVLKLLNMLLPPLQRNNDDRLHLDKSKVISDHPEFLQQLETDILPSLLEVASGANSSICCSCLSFINKLVLFSRSDRLLPIIENTKISSFLAGMCSQNDAHIQMTALRVVEVFLQRLPPSLNAFMKEGVIYAIDAILKHGTPKSSKASSSSKRKYGTRDVQRCLCYNGDLDSSLSSTTGSCVLEDDSVYKLARHLRAGYFAKGSKHGKRGLTKMIQKLRSLSQELTDTLNTSMNNVICDTKEEQLSQILGQTMVELHKYKSMSTFEFVESGVVQSFLNYLLNGQYLDGKLGVGDLSNHFHVIIKRFEMFAKCFLPNAGQNQENQHLALLVQRLLSSLHSLENNPVIMNDTPETIKTYATIPTGRDTLNPCFLLCFVREEGETTLCEYGGETVTAEPFSSVGDLEKYLWPKISDNCVESSSGSTENQKLRLFLDGQQLNTSMTLYQLIVQLQMKAGADLIKGPRFWNKIYKITYRAHVQPLLSNGDASHLGSIHDVERSYPEQFLLNETGFSGMVSEFLCDFEDSIKTCGVVSLLKLLESLNRYAFHLMSQAQCRAFAGEKTVTLNDLRITIYPVPQTEFVSHKLTSKLQQQMKDPLAVFIGCVPSWCDQLLAVVPFLFSFETRCQYFHMRAYSSSLSTITSSAPPNYRTLSSFPKRRFQITRGRILDSAVKVFDHQGITEAILEVAYHGEVGTGLGPTMEFYTLISHEFQKVGLGMWRSDFSSSTSGRGLKVDNSASVLALHGHFPRPWAFRLSTSDEARFSEVIKKYTLLGNVVAKALQDRRVLDLPLSMAFYKLILGKELNVYDIHSFDPELGRTLVEFQSIVERKRLLESSSKRITRSMFESCFRDVRIEDLCLDFSLPGYPDYTLAENADCEEVTIYNLDEYVSFLVDATIRNGISRQVEAFKSGFNQVFPIQRLQIFTEEELEHLLCGELFAWDSNVLLNNIKFDHGYTASSPQITNFMEIIQGFENSQQRSFLQFVTGAPKFPVGGLAALNPKLTVVRKHCNNQPDWDLPSVMTCANYLKLPPYSCKEIMKERLLLAISEGQGSFHLS